jgi:leucyl aminopeptidase
MDFRTQTLAADATHTAAADALLVILFAEQVVPDLGPPLVAAMAELLASGDFRLDAGSAIYLHRVEGAKAPRLGFVVAANRSPKAIKAATVRGLALFKGLAVAHLAVRLATLDAVGEAGAEAVVAGIGDASYVYRQTKPSAAPESRLSKVSLLVASKAEATAAGRGVKRGAAIVEGATFARELANLPANHCTPSDLAARARAVAKGAGMKIEVLERKDLEKLGMGAFLAVAQASDEPPKFIVIRHDAGIKGEPPVVLIGKGVTFDSGGISLKPAAEMDEMKFDMSGAAAVLGTLVAVNRLGARINLIVVIAATENMPGGRAVKPGDVVTSLSGQTIEILNTDAEGRLLLCDALTYVARFEPALVIDVATLTGACVVALGHYRSGLFSSDDALVSQLEGAGEAAIDPCWRMPHDDDYDEGLKSNFADVANVGPRPGGAITAARFLARFAKASPWAHLDIAGTGWKSGAAKGATGRPVGLLTHFLLQRAKWR